MRQVESKEGAEVERREVQNTVVFTVDGIVLSLWGIMVLMEVRRRRNR